MFSRSDPVPVVRIRDTTAGCARPSIMVDCNPEFPLLRGNVSAPGSEARRIAARPLPPKSIIYHLVNIRIVRLAFLEVCFSIAIAGA